MMLSAGIRLGSYEVLAQTGAGGMDEVNRARVTPVDRSGPLKMLGLTF
jgi:hypothetical protein